MGYPNAEARRQMERVFVERFMANGGNGAQAAIDAGYSKTSAKVTACRLLKRDNIKAMLAERSDQVMAKVGLSTERWAAEMDAIGHFDPADLYDADGNLIPIHLLPERARRAISSVDAITDKIECVVDKDGKQTRTTRTVTTTKKIRFHDKNVALANIGKHLGVFDADNRQKAGDIKVMIQLVG